MENKHLKALFMVVNAGFAEDVIEIAREEGVKGATIFNARGEGSHHESFLGITVDTEKEMVFCITDEHTAEKAMESVKDKAGIKTAAHCICFTMPVEKTVGLTDIGE